MSVDVAEKCSVLRSSMKYFARVLSVTACAICAAVVDVCDNWRKALFSSGEA